MQHLTYLRDLDGEDRFLNGCNLSYNVDIH